MMSEAHHLRNRMLFPGTLLEVMHVLTGADRPMSTDEITDALLALSPSENRNNLRDRVATALRALHNQGRLERSERRTEKNFIQYLYAPCSTGPN